MSGHSYQSEQEMVLVSVNRVDRSKDNKSELVFAKLVNPLTYEGRELMVNRECLLPPVGTRGFAIVSLGEFQGRTTVGLTRFDVVSK